MQQKVRRKSGKKKPCKTIGSGISQTDRSRYGVAVQSHYHSETEHSECKNAHSKGISGTGIEKSRASAQLKQSFLSTLFIFLIDIYRNCISPWYPPCCRFTPTCSGYAVAALKIHGPFKGLILTAWRIIRCNPLCKGGCDPVPPKGAWRPLNSE